MTLLEERGLTESHDACQQRDESAVVHDIA